MATPTIRRARLAAAVVVATGLVASRSGSSPVTTRPPPRARAAHPSAPAATPDQPVVSASTGLETSYHPTPSSPPTTTGSRRFPPVSGSTSACPSPRRALTDDGVAMRTCGAELFPARGILDRRTVSSFGPEYGEARDLRVFADDRAAHRFLVRPAAHSRPAPRRSWAAPCGDTGSALARRRGGVAHRRADLRERRPRGAGRQLVGGGPGRQRRTPDRYRRRVPPRPSARPRHRRARPQGLADRPLDVRLRSRRLRHRDPGRLPSRRRLPGRRRGRGTGLRPTGSLPHPRPRAVPGLRQAAAGHEPHRPAARPLDQRRGLP